MGRKTTSVTDPTHEFGESRTIRLNYHPTIYPNSVTTVLVTAIDEMNMDTEHIAEYTSLFEGSEIKCRT